MKTIFWNVDTQYDFMRPDGRLYITGAELIEPRLEEITRLARERGMQIVNTADAHNKDSEELSENPDFKTTFPEHCMKGTRGMKYVPATMPVNPYKIDWEQEEINLNVAKDSREVVLLKDKFDVFAGSPYARDLVHVIKPDRAIVYGVARNVCVDYAVMGLRGEGVDVVVPLDATKELATLDDVVDKWRGVGVRIATTEEIRRYL